MKKFTEKDANYIINKIKESIGKLEIEPFEHIVIDDFLPKDLLKEISDNFPDSKSNIWDFYNYSRQIKRVSNQVAKFPSPVRELFYFLNSYEFISPLSELLNIKKITSDPYFYGAGLHKIDSGGRLDIHADFSQMSHLDLFRRANLIIYFNTDWKNEYGGNLELWNKDLSACEKSVSPIGNRAVIFRTDTSSYHGHPKPLKTPKGISRKSMAVYYYTIEKDNRTFGIDTRWRDSNKTDMKLKYRIRRSIARSLWKVSNKIEKVSNKINKSFEKLITRIDVN